MFLEILKSNQKAKIQVRYISDFRNYIHSMNEMKAKIAAVGTVCIVGSPVNEPEEIQKLKTDPFPAKIRVGNDAVLKCLYDLTDHAGDVQNRLKKNS